MKSRGFSLLEVLFVMVVMSILTAIATLSFKDYYRRYRTEAQTRLLFGELQNARVNAVCQRRTVRVKVYGDRFEVYSSASDSESGVKPLQTHPLTFPIECKIPFETWNPELGFGIDFKRDGLSKSNLSICIEENAGAGVVDSIVIFSTRTSIGKKD